MRFKLEENALYIVIIAVCLGIIVGAIGYNFSKLETISLPEDTMGSEYQPSIIDGVRSLFGILAEDYFEGIDVSHWQGAIDYGNTCGGFVFVRATAADSACNLYEDSAFEVNANGFTLAGVPWDAYHFFRPNCDPIAQADLFVNAIQSKQRNMLPVVDVEVTGGLTSTAIGNAVNTFSARVQQRLGQLPMIYTSPGFWANVSGTFENELWVAHWGVSSPTLPHGFTSWTFWQYNVLPDGAECGVSSASLDHDRYNGTQEEFNERFLTVVEDKYPTRVKLIFDDGMEIWYVREGE